MTDGGVTGEGAGSAVFLVNPASANGATGRRWPEIARAAASVGLVGDARFSSRPGELTELATNALTERPDLLVVVGGDGSVYEVSNALADVDSAPPIAVIPQGTGWDFVRTFGIPRDVAAAARIGLEGRTRTIDVGRATFRAWDGTERSAIFANVASAGMSGAIAARANETTKALGGKASYLIATLRVFARWRPEQTSIFIDGVERSGSTIDVIVANGRFFGGGMKICPDAVPDDGTFDVLTIGAVTKADLVRTMPKIYRGTHLPHPKAQLARGRIVEIHADPQLPVQLDGEQPGTTPARFEVIPSALRLRVPADR